MPPILLGVTFRQGKSVTAATQTFSMSVIFARTPNLSSINDWSFRISFRLVDFCSVSERVNSFQIAVPLLSSKYFFRSWYCLWREYGIYLWWEYVYDDKFIWHTEDVNIAFDADSGSFDFLNSISRKKHAHVWYFFIVSHSFWLGISGPSGWRNMTSVLSKLCILNAERTVKSEWNKWKSNEEC